MISCTEFIPAYSELFTYLEDKYGRDEVDVFWDYLFKRLFFFTKFLLCLYQESVSRI